MKLMLNGAVTLGTLDGANVEIVQQAGLENNYIFGSTVEELESIRDSYQPRELYDSNPLLRRVVDTLVDGTIESDAGLTELHGALLDGASWHKADHYFLLKDFASYLDAKLRANRDYQDRLDLLLDLYGTNMKTETKNALTIYSTRNHGFLAYIKKV